MRPLSAGLLRFLVLALLLLSAGCLGGREDVLAPPELRGRWTTSDPDYADRGMQLLPDAVIFETGNGDFTLHVFHSMEERDTKGGTLYEFRYRTGGLPLYHLDLVLSSGGDTLRLLNQPQVIWTRPWTGR